jgi:hypothetical protein
MKLRTRLFLYGAVIPAGVMVVGFAATGFLMRAHLVEDTDRELLTQAAVESVSLFDGPRGEPHLHLARSPLSAHVQGFMPEGALYDSTGRRVVSTLPPRYAPPSLLSTEGEGNPVFSSTRRGKSTTRALEVVVRSPRGERYMLWVGTPLDAVERTMSWYTRTSAAIVLVSVIISLLVQRRHARSLATRLDQLAMHMSGLRAGRFTPPGPDTNGDVISDLRDAIADTSRTTRKSASSRTRRTSSERHSRRCARCSTRRYDASARRPSSARPWRRSTPR